MQRNAIRYTLYQQGVYQDETKQDPWCLAQHAQSVFFAEPSIV
jgi:hypothetical protein